MPPVFYLPTRQNAKGSGFDVRNGNVGPTDIVSTWPPARLLKPPPTCRRNMAQFDPGGVSEHFHGHMHGAIDPGGGILNLIRTALGVRYEVGHIFPGASFFMTRIVGSEVSSAMGAKSSNL